MKNFAINSSEPISQALIKLGIRDFSSACEHVQHLPYGRTSSRTDFLTVLLEGRGTCSSKHGLLVRLAEENNEHEIELIMGIFLMSPETHPQLAHFFQDKGYKVLPEAHCYLRYKGERFDYTSRNSRIDQITSKLVREQRIEPHQVGEWKVKLHQNFIEGWLRRQINFDLTFDEIWTDREKCIELF